MSLRPIWHDNVLLWRESTTGETVRALAPFWHREEFAGKALDTTNWWTQLDTAGATETVKADAPSGVHELALTSANEAQLAGLSYGDHRPLVLNQGLVFEARVRFTVLPTTGVIACIGLCGDHNAAVDTVAESAWFRLDGATGGLITAEHDDTVNESSKVTTAVTLIANQWTILRIELNTTTALRFFVDGVRKASGTTFNMSTVAALALQPIIRIGKEAASTAVGTLEVDYAEWWQRRAA